MSLRTVRAAQIAKFDPFMVRKMTDPMWFDEIVMNFNGISTESGWNAMNNVLQMYKAEIDRMTRHHDMLECR